MLIKGITDEDFVNYKLPSMYIATATCSFKCDKEYGKPICQNSELVKQPDIDMDINDIVDRYCNNPITHAIVIGGLEPLDQLDDIIGLIVSLRCAGGYNEYEGCPRFDHPKGMDDIVIYTGYTKKEAAEIILKGNCMAFKNNEWQIDYDMYQRFLDKKNDDLYLSLITSGFPNVIIKYGRYIPGHQPHYDPVLGVYLASDNQYAERIS